MIEGGSTIACSRTCFGPGVRIPGVATTSECCTPGPSQELQCSLLRFMTPHGSGEMPLARRSLMRAVALALIKQEIQDIAVWRTA